MSVVVDAASETSDGDDATEPRDPFAGGHVEVEERSVRSVSPSAWLAGVRRRIDELATALTYGR